MKKLNLNVIRTDGGTQAREKLNQETVREYSEHMKDGDVFPPVIVFHDGADYWLADGFHRYFATKGNGLVSIECEVKVGTLDDAILYAFGANGGSKRGLSLSHDDYRKIVLAMLRHPKWSEWTNAAIAKHVGVSKMTVGRIKNIMKPEEKPDTKKKYIDGHGNESVIDTSKLATKRKEPTTKPDVTTADPQQELVEELNVKIGELTDAINYLSEENTLMRDKIAIGQWDASEIEKIDAEETISDLRNQIKTLEAENKALRDGRDTYMNRNAELARTLKSLQTKLKKLEATA
jgi:transposase